MCRYEYIENYYLKNNMLNCPRLERNEMKNFLLQAMLFYPLKISSLSLNQFIFILFAVNLSGCASQELKWSPATVQPESRIKL